MAATPKTSTLPHEETTRMKVNRAWRVNALRVEQHPDMPLYVFGINGRLVHQFARISMAARSDGGVLMGYQRSRVERHIREIREYVAQVGAILPNAIVVAFDGSVVFTPLP